MMDSLIHGIQLNIAFKLIFAIKNYSYNTEITSIIQNTTTFDFLERILKVFNSHNAEKIACFLLCK